MDVSLPSLDQVTGARAGGDLPDQQYQYQLYQSATRWNSQGEVDLSQGDGSSLTLLDAIRVQTWSDASRAHADTSSLHVGHGGALYEGYEREQSIPGLELNFGISEETASGHEHQQPDSGITYVGNDGQLELLTFPEDEVDAVTISASDLEGLKPTRFLSDNIIDFYIKYLERRLSSEDRNRFFFFNSFFLTKLVGNSGASTDTDECDVVYDRVRKWTGEVNLFEKDYVFIPILRSLHWSLIIICHLSSLTRSPDKWKVSPCILHLDPVEGKHESFQEQVRSYLYQACRERYQDSNEKDQMLLAVACRMKYVRAKIPGVEDLVSLETLYCGGSRLKWLPDLHRLPRLPKVWVWGTPLTTTDPSSSYYGKGFLSFNCEEERKGFVDEISDISDTELNHSEDDFSSHSDVDYD